MAASKKAAMLTKNGIKEKRCSPSHPFGLH